MSGQALLFSPLCRQSRAPQFFLASLFDHERAERVQAHEPQTVDEATLDRALAREAGDVVRREMHDASGVARAHVRDAVLRDGC